MGTGLSPLASCPGCGFENPSSFRFCGQCGARLDLAPPSAERRQLTVLFCDVVDSATLAERLDPEELRDVLTSYHAMCGTVIARFGGHTAQVLGDGLLIYFGYPAAHEDDAGRAVHTALGIVEGTRALDERLMRERGLSFAIRCGIHTGAVVAGDLSVGESRERLAIGQTPNIAARLQALAAPGTILVSGASHQLSAGAFECEPLGARTLKGIERPIDVYRVLAEAGAGRAPRPDGRGAPIVGREEQLAALERAFGGAAAGTGQAVLVLGEAGVGKSRLLQAFQTSLAAAPHRLLTCQGSPFDRTSALHPLITMLRRAFELDRPDTAPARHARLREILARLDVSHEHADALLANLLFADPGAAAAPALEHHEQKQRTLDLLIAIVGRMAGDGPAILVMEDMHHADPSTLELLALTVTRLPGMPVLLLMTARPSFVPPWPAEAPVTRLTVDRLDDAQIATLIERVAQNRSLPGELRRQLIERADGVPLFAEELTKAVLESGLLEVRGDRLELAGPLPPLAVPATLQDSLTARLDRLGDAREVAQVAAVIGREFRYEMLRRVYARDEARLLDGLARLEQAEIVVARGTEPAGVYVFKHALLQAAAYALLLKAARRAYHQRVAETLVASFPDEAAAQPELVAHHFSEADAASPAIAYWLQAAERAWQRSADQESVEGLTRALALLPRLPESERDPAELAIQMKLGRALTAMRGYTFGEVERAYSRALELSKALGDALQGFFALDGLHSLHAVRGDMPRIRRISERMLKRARTLGDPALLIAAHYKAGAHHFFGGDFEGARSHYQHAVELSTRHSIERFTTPERADIISRTLLGGALWFLGYPDRARQVCVEAIALAIGGNSTSSSELCDHRIAFMIDNKNSVSPFE